MLHSLLPGDCSTLQKPVPRDYSTLHSPVPEDNSTLQSYKQTYCGHSRIHGTYQKSRNVNFSVPVKFINWLSASGHMIILFIFPEMSSSYPDFSHCKV